MLKRASGRLPVAAVLGSALIAGVALTAVHNNSSGPPLRIATHADYGGLPEYDSLTIPQKLDRSLSLPGIRGLVLGRIGSGKSTLLRPGTGDQAIVTDYPFALTGSYGRLGADYRAGLTVTLRVPAGCLNGLCGSVEAAPSVRSGEDVYVFVRDQGDVWGRNSATLLIVSSVFDVFEVVNGQIVRGQGPWSSFVEPVQVFERHFGRRLSGG